MFVECGTVQHRKTTKRRSVQAFFSFDKFIILEFLRRSHAMHSWICNATALLGALNMKAALSEKKFDGALLVEKLGIYVKYGIDH